MRAEISKSFRFEAAHQLPNHRGKCSRPHGHSYELEIGIEGEIRRADGSSSEGMVRDFAAISEAWAIIRSQLDHRDLNESLGRIIGPTTAENIALWVLRRMIETLPCSFVVVRETASSAVKVRREDLDEQTLADSVPLR